MCRSCYNYARNHNGAMKPIDTGTSGVCINCGKRDSKMTKNMCQNCYRYQHKNGKPRPLDYRERMQRTKYPVCVNCGAKRVGVNKHNHGASGARGMCNNCYQFWIVNGRMRTKNDMIRSRYVEPGFCKNCKESAELYSGLCSACWGYKNRMGKSRPFRLYRQDCSNCGVPFNGYKPQKGRCRPCQNYFGENGVERPAYIWKSDHGWCECSTGLHPVQATHTVKVNINNHSDKLHLCDECFREHQRQVAWYGDKSQHVHSINHGDD